jgi:hypothetical protein
MTVHVRNTSGVVYDVEVTDTDQTVADFISAFVDEHSLPIADYYLAFNGDHLAGDSLLSECSIDGNDEQLTIFTKNIPA